MTGVDLDSLLQQAFTAFDNGQLDRAEHLYLQAMQQNAEVKNETYKSAVNGLAFTYSLQNNFERARELFRLLNPSRKGNVESFEDSTASKR